MSEMLYGTGCLQSGYSDKDIYFEGDLPSIPVEFKLKDVGRVYNQGQNPWCAAYTAKQILEYQYRISNVDKVIDVKDLYDKKHNQGEGMIPRDVFDILLHEGVKCADGKEARIQYYMRINSLIMLQTAIISNGPAFLALPVKSMVSQSFWNGNSDFGGHAITVIGWNRESFILKNTWGNDWGDGGYCYLDFTDFDKVFEAWTLSAKIV